MVILAQLSNEDVMTTQPTNLPIPSENPRDLKFNSGCFDKVINSDENYYVDRFGVRRFTIAGFQYTAEEVIRNYGYITMDSFEDGATLTLPNQVLRYGATGEYYRWDGEFPKSVSSGSAPEASGGVGLGAWVSVGDAALRSNLSDSNEGLGDSLIAVKQPLSNSSERTQHEKNQESVSIKDFGAAGDGTTDDTAALQAALDWLKTGSNKTLLIPGGEYLISAVSVTFSGQSSLNNNIVGDGCLRHSATSGDMITISGAMYCSFNLNIVGDGYDALTIPDYQTADPDGCQQAIVFSGNRACKLKVRATGYPGRVLRVKAGGAVKQSFIDLDITTGNDTCGQAMYLQGTDAWGCISFAQTNWDYYGSVLDTITDVSIVYWEAGVKNQSAPSII
ncbi:TPA: glycosyl hydrolase family 28-related protein, partial [Escherichia coli]